MKIRKNDKGQIEIKLENNGKYSLLFHRISNGIYEQYVKKADKEIILSKEQMNEIKIFIEKMEVSEDGHKRIS